MSKKPPKRTYRNGYRFRNFPPYYEYYDDVTGKSVALDFFKIFGGIILILAIIALFD